MKALVIGAGNFGATVAVEMAAKECEVVLIDIDQEKLDDLKDNVGQVVIGNAKDRDLLEKFARDMDVVVVSLGDIVDASVLVTHHLKDLGTKRIIAKAISDDHGKILKIIGAHQVVFPERDEAIRLVSSLVSPDVLDVVRLSEDKSVVEVAVPQEFIGKSIEALDLRNRYGFHVLAVKNPLKGNLKVVPEPKYQFQPDDVMIVVGEDDQITKLRQKK
ncbi:MAG: potassium uptake system protein [Candidatus Omnitrophica bacterium CG11_big_fil_rev_8_21_14_0_20_45_26]|uniref:Potassium uptake system protein n=1 Tax=Candidatus Abzuiibacterium crystallinum TaxID=1974748 RepID=A0A2H0LM90_9BACT|nr:MAG: potassium uptake system protein [Candidatus Omnitrophica bacterium CG11_big_fil_rev_8_21_14_0_20_45_26]PIW63730.1 MAG: potassium uptake system protein [Candidatus Omnitrophica bacterium CG12_big_fil_rev_8_21_14_0_65_45_16]